MINIEQYLKHGLSMVNNFLTGSNPATVISSGALLGGAITGLFRVGYEATQQLKNASIGLPEFNLKTSKGDKHTIDKNSEPKSIFGIIGDLLSNGLSQLKASFTYGNNKKYHVGFEENENSNGYFNLGHGPQETKLSLGPYSFFYQSETLNNAQQTNEDTNSLTRIEELN